MRCFVLFLSFFFKIIFSIKERLCTDCLGNKFIFFIIIFYFSLFGLITYISVFVEEFAVLNFLYG